MYHILVENSFSAAHFIQKYEGPCGELHGHTWKVQVEVQTTKINKLGISIDFKDLKAITESIIGRLDHQHLNKISPFDQQNPTAENLSKYFYYEIQKKLPETIQMSRVTVWESDSTSVTFSES